MSYFVGQVVLYVSKGCSAVIFMVKHPKYEGTVILPNIRNYLPSDSVTSQKTSIFTYIGLKALLPFSLRKPYVLKFIISGFM
jgi:Zn-dependent M28 family amino/carboxypeptidase